MAGPSLIELVLPSVKITVSAQVEPSVNRIHFEAEFFRSAESKCRTAAIIPFTSEMPGFNFMTSLNLT